MGTLTRRLTRTARLGALLLIALAASAAGPTTKDAKDEGKGGKETQAKAFKVPRHGDLLLAVPDGWKDAMRPQPGMPPTIEFTGGREKAFSVQVSIIPLGSAARNSPGNVRKMAERMGGSVLESSKEKELALQELKGPEATAWFYTLTDKAPDPGSFEYITGGAEGVGDLLLTVTILHHTKDAPERQAALDMLRGARQSKAVAAAQPAELRVSPPGAAWELVLPARGFEVEDDQTNEAGRARQLMAVNQETGINLSVFMEPAPGAGDSTAVRDTYWGRARKSPMKKEGVALGKVGDYATVQYVVPDVEGLPLQQKNLNLYLAHDGVWVDIHVSKVQFTDKDQALFDAIANGAKVVEKGMGGDAAKAGDAGKAVPR